MLLGAETRMGPSGDREAITRRYAVPSAGLEQGALRFGNLEQVVIQVEDADLGGDAEQLCGLLRREEVP